MWIRSADAGDLGAAGLGRQGRFGLGRGRVKTVRPRETGDAKLNLACYRNCELDSTCTCPALRLIQRRTEEARGRLKIGPMGVM
jgi:hypothetical protein